jgi:hypothetical protein
MGLTISQEFSIEIPDKDADAIHSGMLKLLYMVILGRELTGKKLTKQLNTFSRSQMVSPPLPYTQIHPMLKSEQRIKCHRALEECTWKRSGKMRPAWGAVGALFVHFDMLAQSVAKPSIVTTYRTNLTHYCSTPYFSLN